MIVGMPHPANRIEMVSSRYYLADELVDKCKQHYAPNNTTYFEYSPNRFVKINNDTELKFACEVVARAHVEFYGLDIESCVRIVTEPCSLAEHIPPSDEDVV